MSTAARDEREDEREEKRNPAEPLTHRATFQMYLRDTALRPYLLTALGGLAMIFLVLFLNGGDIGAVFVTVYGLAILALRWTMAPPVWLLFLLYFLIFPFGVPEAYFDNPAFFRVVDVVLVMAVLVYLRSLYRVFGIVQQSMPFESLLRRKNEHPTRRPTAHIAPDEIGWLVGGAAALVMLGQVLWWLANAIEFAPLEDFPLRWADQTVLFRSRRDRRPPGEFEAGASRFFVILGALLFGFLFVRLVFGYWRLRTMNAAEGAMVTTDASWAESHRERVRVEKWRIWGRQKGAEKAKQEARAERQRERTEAERARRRKIDAHVDEAVHKRSKARDDDEDDRPRRRPKAR